jgi:hypothetical protein
MKMWTYLRALRLRLGSSGKYGANSYGYINKQQLSISLEIVYHLKINLYRVPTLNVLILS